MNEQVEKKFPRIVVTKISNGFLVTICPENKELQKLMQGYVKDIMNRLQVTDGDEWKLKMEKSIEKAISGSDDSIKIFACKNAFEVMAVIAPVPEGDLRKKGKPDLAWFWSEQGHIPD